MTALLRLPRVIIGNAFVLGCISFLWLMKKNGHYINFVADGKYSFEKTFHLLAFLFFNSLIMHLYMRTEQKHTRHLHEKNADIENLLRVLLHDIANTLSSMTYQLIRVKEEGDHPIACRKLIRLSVPSKTSEIF